jgi:hypothetical protein
VGSSHQIGSQMDGSRCRWWHCGGVCCIWEAKSSEILLHLMESHKIMKISPDSTNVSPDLAKIPTDMGEDQQVRGPDGDGRHSTCKWSVKLVKIGFWDEKPATQFDTSGFKGQDPLHVG